MRASAAGVIYVQPGGTLSQIAATYCGSAQDWNSIYQANRAALTSGPNVVYPGEALRVSCHGYQAPAQASSQPATQARVTTAVSSSSSFQACVISRESGGNPGAVNPASGAGGLYQFLPSTWASLGYSGLPENAPVSEQNAAFNKLYAQAGTSPWAPSDGC